MRLLLHVSASSGDYYGDVALGYVEITADLARRILRLRDDFRALDAREGKQLASLHLYDHSVDFYAESAFPARLSDGDEEFDLSDLDSYLELGEEDPGPEGEPERVEACELVLTDTSFWWTARPKYSNHDLETYLLSYSLLEPLAKEGESQP